MAKTIAGYTDVRNAPQRNCWPKNTAVSSKVATISGFHGSAIGQSLEGFLSSGDLSSMIGRTWMRRSGKFEVTQRRGVRRNAVKVFLRPVIRRPNLRT